MLETGKWGWSGGGDLNDWERASLTPFKDKEMHKNRWSEEREGGNERRRTVNIHCL